MQYTKIAPSSWFFSTCYSITSRILDAKSRARFQMIKEADIPSKLHSVFDPRLLPAHLMGTADATAVATAFSAAASAATAASAISVVSNAATVSAGTFSIEDKSCRGTSSDSNTGIGSTGGPREREGEGEGECEDVAAPDLSGSSSASQGSAQGGLGGQGGQVSFSFGYSSEIDIAFDPARVAFPERQKATGAGIATGPSPSPSSSSSFSVSAASATLTPTMGTGAVAGAGTAAARMPSLAKQKVRS
jgi:hypothetical protein